MPLDKNKSSNYERVKIPAHGDIKIDEARGKSHIVAAQSSKSSFPGLIEPFRNHRPAQGQNACWYHTD